MLKTHGYCQYQVIVSFTKLHYNLVTGIDNDNDELVYQTLSGTGCIKFICKIFKIKLQ